MNRKAIVTLVWSTLIIVVPLDILFGNDAVGKRSVVEKSAQAGLTITDMSRLVGSDGKGVQFQGAVIHTPNVVEDSSLSRTERGAGRIESSVSQYVALLQIDIYSNIAITGTYDGEVKELPNDHKDSAHIEIDLFDTAMTLYRNRDFQGFDESVSRFRELFPRYPRLQDLEYYEAISTDYHAEQWEKALRMLQDYIERYPHGSRVPEAAFHVVQLHYFMENFEEYERAASKFKQEFQDGPNNHYLPYYDAMMAFRQGKWEAAIDELTDFVDTHPDCELVREAEVIIVQCYQNLGDFKSAKELGHKHPEYVDQLAYTGAVVPYRNGDWEKARVTLRDFVDQYPHSPMAPEADFARIQCLLMLTLRDAFLREVKEYIRMYPNSIHVLELLQGYGKVLIDKSGGLSGPEKDHGEAILREYLRRTASDDYYILGRLETHEMLDDPKGIINEAMVFLASNPAGRSEASMIWVKVQLHLAWALMNSDPPKLNSANDAINKVLALDDAYTTEEFLKSQWKNWALDLRRRLKMMRGYIVSVDQAVPSD